MEENKVLEKDVIVTETNEKVEPKTEKKVKKEKAEVKSEKTNAKPQNVVPYIYVGPTIPEKILVKNKVYKEVPKVIKEFIEKNSVLSKLFIPVDDFAEFKTNVAKKGTLEYQYYLEAIKFIKSKGGLL